MSENSLGNKKKSSTNDRVFFWVFPADLFTKQKYFQRVKKVSIRICHENELKKPRVGSINSMLISHDSRSNASRRWIFILIALRLAKKKSILNRRKSFRENLDLPRSRWWRRNVKHFERTFSCSRKNSQLSSTHMHL